MKREPGGEQGRHGREIEGHRRDMEQTWKGYRGDIEGDMEELQRGHGEGMDRTQRRGGGGTDRTQRRHGRAVVFLPSGTASGASRRTCRRHRGRSGRT